MLLTSSLRAGPPTWFSCKRLRSYLKINQITEERDRWLRWLTPKEGPSHSWLWVIVFSWLAAARKHTSLHSAWPTEREVCRSVQFLSFCLLLVNIRDALLLLLITVAAGDVTEQQGDQSVGRNTSNSCTVTSWTPSWLLSPVLNLPQKIHGLLDLMSLCASRAWLCYSNIYGPAR